ncbi:MAG: Ig-like domain-containing protein [Hyphomicrobiaceae bacterium]|nr:Ig-like domain-containing protein [Hyphomicrobiaceae bacterium]
MAASGWGTFGTEDFIVSGTAAAEDQPAIADSVGLTYGVAWRSTGAGGETDIIVKFFNTVGEVDLLGTMTLSDGVGYVSGPAIASAGDGFAVIWEESAAAGASADLHIRYIGTIGPIGGEITLATAAHDHDAVVAGFELLDAAGGVISTGFDVAWIATAEGAADARFGDVMFQRFELPLNPADPNGDPFAPAAAGLDGIAGTADDATQAVLGTGRDVAIAVTHDGEAIVSWIGGDGQIHLRIIDADGTELTATAINGAPAGFVDAIGAVDTNSALRIAAINGTTDFVIAWTADNGAGGRVVNYQVFSQGAAVDTWDFGPVVGFAAPLGFNGEIGLVGLEGDTSGFAITLGSQDADGSAGLAVRTFNANGAQIGGETVVNTTVVGAQNAHAVTGLTGDRLVVAYQDTSTDAAGDIRTQIMDTRAAGLAFAGDAGGARQLRDILVGTIGNDTIDGAALADEFYGALGDDILTGGTGSDLIDGGGNSGLGADPLTYSGAGDVAVYSGNRADYSIAYNGDGTFSITDNRTLPGGAPGEGTDLIRNVEFFRFADGTVAAETFLPPPSAGTPTPWSLENARLDGYLLSEDPAVRAQGAVSLAENFGEFYGVAWRVDVAGTDRIRVQLFNSDGSPDEFLPDPFLIDDGIGTVVSDPTIGGWGDGYIVTWLEQDGGSTVLRARFTGPESIVGEEFTIATTDGTIGTPIISAYEIVEPNPTIPGELSITSGFNVMWVQQAADGGAAVMLQRYMVPLDDLGNPSPPEAAGIDGKSGDGANEAIVVGTGRGPSMAVAHDGETIVTWIDDAGLIQGRIWNADGSANATVLANIGAVPAGQSQQVVPLGAGNFGIVWVEDDPTAGGPVVKAQTYVLGAGAGAWIPGVVQTVVSNFELTQGDPASFTGELRIAGLGEANEGFLVVFGRDDGDGKGIFAKHVNGVGVPVGDVARINDGILGDQGLFGVGGLISDRFVVAYRDGADGDVVTRIMDTRNPAGETIFGDLVLPAGGLRARREEIYGTVGDDFIDGRGNDDKIVGGLGNDTIVGNVGSDLLLAGEDVVNGLDAPSSPMTDVDTAIYASDKSRYSITVNGDGSFTVKDMRPSGVAGDPGPDGQDVIKDFEQLRFGGVPGTDEVSMDLFFQTLPSASGLAGIAAGGVLSTNDFAVNTDPAGVANLTTGLQDRPAAAALQNNFAVVWRSGDALYGKAYDVLGQPDPLFGTGDVANPQAQAFRLDDGAGVVERPYTTMAGDLGFLTIWQETDAGGATSVRFRHASVLDGPVGVEAGVTAAAPGVAQHNAVAAGYEIVDAANDTLEFGFNAVWVESGAAGTAGNIMMERFSVFSVPAGDTPGIESQPISIGLDGLAATAGDNTSILVAQGRDPSMASLHDGQQVIGYIDGSGNVQLAMYVPVTDLATEIDDDGDVATPTVPNPHYGVTDLTAGPAFAPVGAVGGAADHVQVVGLGFNFAVVWSVDGRLHSQMFTGNGGSWVPSGDVDLGITVPAGGEFRVMPAGEPDIAADSTFLVSWENVTVSGATEILVQRFDAAGAAVGTSFAVSGDGDTTVADAATGGLAVAGLLDGRVVVVYQGQADNTGPDATDPDGIVARMLETRIPGQVIIGPRDGAPRDVLVGTAGDDVLDGRALEDELHGGLGNDVLLGGSETDLLFGEAGNDTLLGGSENDALDGGQGDDLLLGGFGRDTIDGGAGLDTLSYQGEFARFQIDLTAALVAGQRQVLSDRNPNTGALLAAFGIEDVYTGIENVTGGESADTITGSGAANVLLGRAGNDVIDGNGEADTIDGGDGDDVLIGGGGADLVLGGGGNDDLSGNADNDTMDGGDGNDALAGGAGDDSLLGGAGDDVLRGNAGNDALDGGDGTLDRAVFGGNFNNTSFTITTNPDGSITVTDIRATGNEGTDTLRNIELLDFNNVTLLASDVTSNLPIALDDVFTTAEDTSLVIDPLDNDVNGNRNQVSIVEINGVSVSVGVPVALTAGAVPAGTLTLGVDDRITFAPAADYNGQVSFAYTVARIADPTLRDTATVTIDVTPVNDAPSLTSPVAVSIAENTQNGVTAAALAALDPEGTAVTFELVGSAEGRFVLVGNQIVVAGSAVLDYETAASHTLQVRVADATGLARTQSITVSLTNLAETTPSAGIVDGTAGNDTRTGAGTDDRIRGLGGDDTLNGGGGNDYLDGGTGRDSMVGGAGNDTFVVDNSSDRLSENANQGNDTVLTTLTSFTLPSNFENVVRTGAGAINAGGNSLANLMAGAAGADTLSGAAGNDTLVGNGGNDQLTGGDGNDLMFGGAGNDNLSGGNGADWLEGGIGNDTLNGGGGSDQFAFFAGFGTDTISRGGFGDTAGDQDLLVFSSAVFADYAAVQAAMTTVAAGVAITSGTNVLTIQGVTVASLGADDFRLV